MRKLNFRAWLKDKKEMVTVYHWHKGDEKDSITVLTSFNGSTTYFDDEMILMQGTTLTDKNGKEIYEGDIVVLGGKYEYPRTIEWHIVGLRCKQINSANNFPLHFPFVGGENHTTDWEVIGNIYQNSELLTERGKEKIEKEF